MRLFLASLAIGIFIPVLLVAIMLAIKILSPGTTPVFLFWFFIWPALFLRNLFPGLTVNQLLLLAFPIGTLVNIVVLSLLGYFGIRAIQRAKGRREQPAPPQPPSF